MMLLNLFLCGLLFIGAVSAQTESFIAYRTTTAATTETVTVQQATTGSKSVSFQEGYVYCSLACVVTLSVDGTAATTTEFTPVALPRKATPGTATARAFHTSNVGAGTTLIAFDVPAGTDKTIDLKHITMLGDGAARNFSIKATSASGNFRIAITWEER